LGIFPVPPEWQEAFQAPSVPELPHSATAGG